MATLHDHPTPLGLGAHRDGAAFCPADAEILDIWAEHGIPADQSTIETATEILLKLWARHTALMGSIDQVGDGMPIGSARAYDVPCLWTPPGAPVPAVLRVSFVDGTWAVSCTPDRWATLWLSMVPAEPWGPWRASCAPKNDARFATPSEAVAAALNTDQVEQ